MNDLAPYRMVIWFTGDEFGGFAGPGAAGETALGTWLDAGNCLFLSGQDYLYDRLSSSGTTPNTFMSTYLGLATQAMTMAITPLSSVRELCLVVWELCR